MLTRKQWWVLHRYVGLVTCVGVVLWGLSGVMHPIMSRLQPKPLQFMPPKQSIDLKQALPISMILRQQHLNQVQQIGLATIRQQPYYRVQLIDSVPKKPARYFALQNGQELLDGDRLYAQELARHYMAGMELSKTHAARFVDHFDDDYHRVNRLLPVWQITFNDSHGLRAYIDTEQARLATLSNDTRQQLTTLFRLAHNMSFLGENRWLRGGMMSLLLTATFLSGASGIYFYVIFRANAARRLNGSGHRAWARWHRHVGILVSVTTLTWSISGAYHLWHGLLSERINQATPIAEGFSVSELEQAEGHLWPFLQQQPFSRLSVIRLQGQVLWLVTKAKENPYAGGRARVAELASASLDEHAHHNAPTPTEKLKSTANSHHHDEVMASDGHAFQGGMQQLAKELAAFYAHQPVRDVVDVQRITKFGDEYGFLNKRLPVYKVAFRGETHPRYYVEPSTGALAAKIDDGDALEGKSFSYLHKWHFFEGGKDWRDILSALWALMNVAVAVMGCVLFCRLSSDKTKER